MENSKEKKSEIEQAGDDLLNFVVDREDIKWLIKVYGTINKAYEKYIHEYLTEQKDGC